MADDRKEDPLAQARRHVAQGMECVARQSTLVDELRRDGHSTVEAQALLAEFERTLVLMRDHLAYEEARAANP